MDLGLSERMKPPDVINEAPEQEREGFSHYLDDKTRREVKGLLDYAVEKPRGLTNPRYARLRPQMSVDEAVSFSAEMRAIGRRLYTTPTSPIPKSGCREWFTFRDLLITPGDKRVQDVVRTDVITAPEHLKVPLDGLPKLLTRSQPAGDSGLWLLFRGIV